MPGSLYSSVERENDINILQVSRYIHVGSKGGTERYLLDLIRGLVGRGYSSDVVWLNQDRQADDMFTDANGTQIISLSAPAGYVDTPSPEMRRRFSDCFRLFDVDVIHFHTFSLSEALLAEESRSLGIPYVFTYHSPAWSCRRGDLLRWGAEICDGEVRPWRCSACMIQKRLDCPVPTAWALTGMLAPLGLLGRFAKGKLHRRTAFIEDTARFRSALKGFLGGAGAIVACSEWSVPILERNGASRNKIVHSPQGVSMDFARAAARMDESPADDGLFTVGYVGRVTPVKGVHILVEAFSETEYPDARLRIIGCDGSDSGQTYLNRLRHLAGDDFRVEFVPKQPFEAMLQAYLSLDLLAIPSIWLETGPLTLLEGLALGGEVWGSAMIGQMQTLEEHGRVVRPNTASAWKEALESAFARHRAKEIERGRNSSDVRTMEDVAEEMVALYGSLIADGSGPALQ